MQRGVLSITGALVLACAPDLGDILDDIDNYPRATESSSSDTGATPTTPTTTAGVGDAGTGDAGTGDASGGTGVGEESTGGVGTSGADSGGVETSGEISGDAGTSEGTAADGGEDVPNIVKIELPAEVHTAGGVPITVVAENTTAVRVKLDGVEVGQLEDVGFEAFTGELVVKGAVDNGFRTVEVIASLGALKEDSEVTGFAVSVPATGTLGWGVSGPIGGFTNRVALTPDGDVVEGGVRVVAGVERPAVRKLSGADGDELWFEPMLVGGLKGAVADVAVAPDGGIWVAMNVVEENNKTAAHIVLLTPDGFETGVEYVESAGSSVRALAADASGGCFAAGVVAVVGGEDLTDVAYWRIGADHVQQFEKTWDYVPPKIQPHTFSEDVRDVVLDGSVATIVGMRAGDLGQKIIEMRGIVVRVDINTGEVVGPVGVAPADGVYTQSMFYGGGVHPDGVLTTGFGCNAACDVRRIEASLFTPGGVRAWHQPEEPADGAHGLDVVGDSQGRVVVTGASKQGGVYRGQVFARMLGEVVPPKDDPVWEYWFPASKEISEGRGIVADKYDRIFVGGFFTVGGKSQAKLLRFQP